MPKIKFESCCFLFLGKRSIIEAYVSSYVKIRLTGNSSILITCSWEMIGFHPLIWWKLSHIFLITVYYILTCPGCCQTGANASLAGELIIIITGRWVLGRNKFNWQLKRIFHIRTVQVCKAQIRRAVSHIFLRILLQIYYIPTVWCQVELQPLLRESGFGCHIGETNDYNRTKQIK